MTNQRHHPVYVYSKDGRTLIKTDQIRCTERNLENTYWDRITRPIALPEFIEGNAKGTIRRIDGQYYRKGTRRQANPITKDEETGVVTRWMEGKPIK
jgi:hypothetical protein